MTTPTNTSTVRPPIVAVLGHVDHGKSSLLDYIRKSNIVAGEAGGITQHVAAYEVTHTHEGTEKRITFIDTPGHAAFRAIRARGANIADIAILVVAADDGVKAQTLEALESIRESGIPFVVAINKIDKPNADIERTKVSLLENEVYLEKLGGDVPWAPVSAKTGDGIPDLLDLVLITAELAEYSGDVNVPATGYVVEAHRDQKRGIAATLIITDGCMSSGQFVSAGEGVAPLRIMEDHTGAKLSRACFSTPVRVVGFSALPSVGSTFSVHDEKHDAEEESARHTTTHTATIFEEDEKYLPLVVKADVVGSLDAIEYELGKLSSEQGLHLRIVQKGIGAVSEGDIKAALAAPGTQVIAFNTYADTVATDLARQHNISIEAFSIIYELIEHVAKAANEYVPRAAQEEVVGTAKVLKVFSKKKDEHLVGARVLSGELRRAGLLKVTRGDEEIGTGELLSIQSGKQNVDRIEQGAEFGAFVETISDLSGGDVLTCYVINKAN